VFIHAHHGAANRLAWEILVKPSTTPVGDWEVLLDVITGQILKVVVVVLRHRDRQSFPSM